MESMMQNETLGSDIHLLLLRTSSALVMADSEQEILAAVSLFGDEQMCVRLLYVVSDQETVTGVKVVASRKGGKPWHDDPALCQTFSLEDYPLLKTLGTFQNPVLYVEDITTFTPPPDFTGEATFPTEDLLPHFKAFALIRLYTQGGKWEGLLCFSWSEVHILSVEEEYLYAGMAQTVSAVIANRLLHQRALENIERLKELDKMKNHFIFAMSHEFRTPLTNIIGNADIILTGISGEVQPKVSKNAQHILSSGKHLLDLVNGILTLAQIEAGTLQLELEEVVDLGVPILETVGIVQYLADDKTIAIHPTLLESFPPMLIDVTRVRQVIVNLLSNAIKFSPHGSNIQINTQLCEGYLVLSVEDHGEGISPEHQKLLFEPFRQIESQLRVKKHQGAGLGLSLSKKLVELHGGTMWVESVLEQGSTFYFSLPYTGDDQ